MDLRPLTNQPSVEVTFDFLSRGKYSPTATEACRPHVASFLKRTYLFSEINPKGTPSDYSMRIQMNNVVDSPAGAYASGFVTGLTLGGVGSKVTDKYVITAHLENRAGGSVTNEYHYAIVSTIGLVDAPKENVTPYDRPGEALQEIVDQFLLKWLMDLQKSEQLRSKPVQPK